MGSLFRQRLREGDSKIKSNPQPLCAGPQARVNGRVVTGRASGLKNSAPTTHIIMSESQQPLVRGKRLTIMNDDDDDYIYLLQSN